MTDREAAAYSPNVLAFYGDSVYEVLVRKLIVSEHQTNAGKLHSLAVQRVRASYQSEALSIIEPLLNEKEADIVRRGRNAGGISVPKSSNPAEYRRATALETLFGYLSLCEDYRRIQELFDAIIKALPIEE